MRIVAPSPTGRNTAGLYITGPVAKVMAPRAAYDAAPGDDDRTDLILFLKERLTEADFNEACRIGKLDAGVTMDEPEPFAGRPTPGGKLIGQDAASRADFARRFPHAAKIKVSA